jgi:hypothetical protein
LESLRLREGSWPIGYDMAPMDKPSPDVNSDRRRRNRLRAQTPGWIMPEDQQTMIPWEVRVCDVSRHGVGFESGTELQNGEVIRIRIGRGPLELAKRMRVVRCHRANDGRFAVGGEFV